MADGLRKWLIWIRWNEYWFL